MENIDKIDKIYYINLDYRTDRNEQFSQQIATHFKDGILESRIERFPAIKHNHGLLGCSMSHLEVIKKAKADGARYVLVFEDDFEFIVSRETFENNLTKLFEQVTNNGIDFKVVMLAYNTNNRAEIANNDILDSSTDVQTCAGYLVNSAYYDELIQCWEEGVRLYQETWRDWIYCCDQYWKKLQKEKWFIFKTRIGKQCAGFSDCGKCFVNYNC
jgi:GR25 family glycosyltransferase involved in LPS biosynthesis